VTHPERGTAILDRLAEELAELGVVEQRPMQEGRNMTMMMAPSKAVLSGRADGDAHGDDGAAAAAPAAQAENGAQEAVSEPPAENGAGAVKAEPVVADAADAPVAKAKAKAKAKT
jgi:translation initiation factor IF-3